MNAAVPRLDEAFPPFRDVEDDFEEQRASPFTGMSLEEIRELDAWIDERRRERDAERMKCPPIDGAEPPF